MSDRVATGIDGLDKMLAGGLIQGTVAVVRGAAGTGKSSLGMEYLAHGIENAGENGLYVSLEEFAQQIYRDSESLGFDFKKYEADGKLNILVASPDVFIDQIKESGGAFDRIMVENDVRRIVVDSMNTITESMCPDDCRRFVYSFINGLRRYQATAVILEEEMNLLGCGPSPNDHGLCFLADTIITLKYVEIDSSLKRAILVVKQRATPNDNRIHGYEITDHGLVVGAPFADMECILSGQPHDAKKQPVVPSV
jgi:circadian clock protein KaiC